MIATVMSVQLISPVRWRSPEAVPDRCAMRGAVPSRAITKSYTVGIMLGTARSGHERG